MEGSGFRGTISELEFAVKREKRSRDNSCSDDGQNDSKQGIFSLKDNKLEVAKAEMGEVKEENQRLKKHLSQMMEEYKILHKKFRDAVDNQQEIELQGNQSVSTLTTTHQEHDLISLSLGRSAPTSSINQKENENHQNKSNPNKDEDDKEGLALGLDCKFEAVFRTMAATVVSSAENSVKEVIREEIWPPGKVLKKDKKSTNEDDHEATQQNPAAKKTRVSVRVRCDSPTMNDGCQWRKYGQKISKGNPCPRAYYRCTVSTTCPVKKQVQRCAQDMSILITTYEGTHNHPLSTSATAMASTTSAAASMLMSGSSTSGSSNTNNPSSTTTPAELHGLNFYFSDGSKPNTYYPQNPSPSCPTITLDLTSNTLSSPSSPSIFNKSSPSNFLPRYSSTNLNFGSWSNTNAALTFSSNSQPYIKNSQSLNFGRNHQENVNQPYLHNNMQKSLQANTIEAATKAITSDPNFQSVLQAALSSIMSSSGIGPSGNGGGGGGQNSNLTEALFPILSSFVPSTSNASTNLLKKSSSPTENMMFPPPSNSSSSFSASKRKSTSPDDSRDHVN